MFKQAKMYADRGNGCFTNQEILSIRLLGIMRDIGAPLKAYGRIVATLFKDVITEREAIATICRHWHTAINHFSNTILHERAVSHCYDPARSCKQSFLPSPCS
jgi:hypothetical protein